MGSDAPGVPAPAVLDRLGLGQVTVAEVTAECLGDGPPEIPWHLTPPTGLIALQLRTTVRRIAIGAGLARDAELVDRVRAIPGAPPVVTSPAGGTFIVGGDGWLGLCAIGSPRAGQPMPLDWMVHSLRRWLEAALRPFGVAITLGRVDGAWCPGFSDIAAGGRKLAGLGFRVTRDCVVMRGVLAVRPVDAADLELLARCHALVGVEVRAASCVSLSEASGRSDLDVATTISSLRTVSVDAAA